MDQVGGVRFQEKAMWWDPFYNVPLGRFVKGLGRDPEHAVGEEMGPLIQLGDCSNKAVPVDGVVKHLFFEKQLHDLIGRIVFALSPFAAVDDQGLLSGLGKVEDAAQ